MRAPATAPRPCPSPPPITAASTVTPAPASLGLTPAAFSSSHPHLRRRDRGSALFLSSRWTCTHRFSNQIPQANGESALPLEENQNSQKSKIVHVKFMLRKECTFGQQLLLVGNISQLGQWDIAKAIHLEWSDDHVWTIELALPAEGSIHFKFILQSSPGEFVWQPGPDRVLQTRETSKAILVCEDWVDPGKQTIKESDLLGSITETEPAHNNIEADRNVETDEENEDPDEGFPTDEIGKKISEDNIVPAIISQSKYQLVPGIENGPSLDAEVSSMGSGLSASEVIKKEEGEGEEKVRSGKERKVEAEALASTTTTEIASKYSFDAAADDPSEGVTNQKEEMPGDDDDARNQNQQWGREGFSKLFLLAAGFFVRDLSRIEQL